MLTFSTLTGRRALMAKTGQSQQDGFNGVYEKPQTAGSFDFPEDPSAGLADVGSD